MLYAVIMAGGWGTRLWPLSRKRSPKQTIELAGGKSLFQMTLERLEGLVERERTFVITNEEMIVMLSAQAPSLPRENIIGEPFGRDSAAAALLGAAIAHERDKDAVVFTAAADHLISPVETFRNAVKKAAAIAEARRALVTFGIPASHASTAYGYIEKGEAVGGTQGAFVVKKFHEKPDRETAERYVEGGAHFWNSGMFVWRADAALAEAEQNAGAHYRAIAPLGAAFGKDGFENALRRAYEKIEKISIDYAIMEKAKNVVVVEADFGWNDVGSPVALSGSMPADDAGNITVGMAQVIDSKGCVVMGATDRLVAVFGCKGMVVVQAGDATLVCPAERTDDLKKLIARLEENDETAKFL